MGVGLAHAGWEPKTEDTFIKQIYIEGNGGISRVYLRVYPVPEVDAACTNASGASLVRLEPLSTTETSWEFLNQQLYSAALSAYVSGKPIRLKMNGCDDWLRPKAVGIQLK